MLTIGDIHIHVHDFKAALRFWSEGLGLNIVEHDPDAAAAYAVLEAQDGSSIIHLFGGAQPATEEASLELGSRPAISFDVFTTDFDGDLVRMLECGGRRFGEIEAYSDMRSITVADPDGNSFVLMEVPED